MKTVKEILFPESKKRKEEFMRIRIACSKWAKEAHDIDKSKTLLEYYKIFLSKCRIAYREAQRRKR
jgi:hypothetical protein